MRPVLLAILALLLAAPTVPAHGSWAHCGGLELVATDHHYLVLDASGPTEGWMWLYVESNGIQHLQRGPGPWGDDACDEGVPTDTGYLLF